MTNAHLLFFLALRNVVRQRRRTAAALLAIALGVAAIIVSGGFIRDIFLQLAEAIVHSQTGHLQIAKSEFFASGSRSPEKHLIADPDGIVALLRLRPKSGFRPADVEPATQTSDTRAAGLTYGRPDSAHGTQR